MSNVRNLIDDVITREFFNTLRMHCLNVGVTENDGIKKFCEKIIRILDQGGNNVSKAVEFIDSSLGMKTRLVIAEYSKQINEMVDLLDKTSPKFDEQVDRIFRAHMNRAASDVILVAIRHYVTIDRIAA